MRAHSPNHATRRHPAIFLLLLLAACSVNPNKDAARKAAIAMTGSPETLTAIVSLTMEGTKTIDGKSTPFTRAISFRRERMREEIAGQITGLDGKVAYSGAHKDSDTVATERRTAIYSHAVGFLLASFGNNPQLSNGRADATDLTVGDTTYTLSLDPQTNRPARITYKSSGKVHETLFDTYQTVHGYTLPYHLVEKADGETIAEWTISRQFPGPDVPGLTAPKF